eukprot:5468980-Amphidinium_carterae.1
MAFRYKVIGIATCEEMRWRLFLFWTTMESMAASKKKDDAEQWGELIRIRDTKHNGRVEVIVGQFGHALCNSRSATKHEQAYRVRVDKIS